MRSSWALVSFIVRLSLSWLGAVPLWLAAGVLAAGLAAEAPEQPARGRAGLELSERVRQRAPQLLELADAEPSQLGLAGERRGLQPGRRLAAAQPVDPGPVHAALQSVWT